MIRSRVILLAALSLPCFPVSHGDTCRIKGLSPEDLNNLSYEPPDKALLSTEQDKEAWRHFVDTYETPARKVQDWYNSIVAAAKSFHTEVLPILKKLTGASADMKKQVLAIPASVEMQKFIFLRILQLQSRLLVIFLPMQNERKTDINTCYRDFLKLFLDPLRNHLKTLQNLLIPGMKFKRTLKRISKAPGQHLPNLENTLMGNTNTLPNRF